MIKALFEILPESVDAANCVLVCEISNEGFSYAIKNEEQNSYIAVAVFQFEKGSEDSDHAGNLHDVIQGQSLLAANFKKVYIMYSFAESVLIPFALYSSLENEKVINLVHGDLQNHTSILTDLVTESGVYNAYRISTPVYNVIKSHFPNASDIHQYSVLLKQQATKEDKLSIIFYPQRIVVKLSEKGKTELINSFCYNTAEDVSYILLNTCKQFEIESVPVEVSGLIEKDSALYKEIYKYFEIINFASLPAECNYAERITQQPVHYFSHIFAIDSCE
ncbi:MAG TPA: DUF3822 family protein [Ginsengibacter sp.]